jgi:hypothetical protein
MFAWLLPFVSSVTLGNDYSIFGPGQQIELMWAVWRGTFPLYMPGFAEGHSTAAMTLGQLYHPLSWISSLMPGYGDGLALEWNTFFRLLSLGLAHGVLYKLCRRLRIPPLSSFLATFPAVYNLRMLDSFRYGASVDAYVGMVLAASAAGFLYLERDSKRLIVLLGVCTYLLTVSGHPQWSFFGLLGVAFFALLFPWLARALDTDSEAPSVATFVRYGRRLALGVATGLLLASPYLLTFYVEYFKTNQSRIANHYTWTLQNADSLLGELSNFLLPFHADVHGAFGGCVLFALAALFPLAALVRRPPKVLWVAYAVGLLAFLFAVGKDSWIHLLLVKTLPLFGVFRVPGRLTLWIPLFLFPIWAWLLRESNRAALSATCAASVLLCASNGFWTKDWLPAVEMYTPHRIAAQGLPSFLDLLVLILSAATATLLGWAALQQRFFRALVALSVAAMLATTWLCLRFGTWIEPKRPTPSFAHIAAAHKASVATQADPGSGMEMGSVTAYLRHGLKPRQALGVIRHQVVRGSSEGEVLRRLHDHGAEPPLFINRPIEPLARDLVATRDQVDLVRNTSNRFVFRVAAAADGYFVLGLPWLPGFTCKMDGTRVPVVKADALFPAIYLPRGTHQVDFCFVSWAFIVGVALAFMTVAGWMLWVFRRRILPVAAGTILAGALLAWLLRLLLLDGPSFQTDYHWTASAETRTLTAPGESPHRVE